MHANFIVERSRCVRKIRPFPRSWRKLCVISLFLEIFRRLIAISIAFYMPNATHAIFSVERSPTMRKMRPFPRFIRKLCIISLLSEIFRRLNAISTVFYTPNASHVVFRRRKEPNYAQNATIYLILKKTVCYFAIVGDISTFKRYIHCILHAERFARRF